MVRKRIKNLRNIVYSTNPDFQYEYNEKEKMETLPNNQQSLRVMLDRKQRAGKSVTLVTGFIGNADDLEKLGKFFKNQMRRWRFGKRRPNNYSGRFLR